MRKFLIGFVGLLVVLVGGALVVPGMIDWNDYKGDIAARVKAATGRDLRIEGNLEISLLPTPRLAVNRVRLANSPGAAERDMVSLKSLRVLIKLAPLLQGRIEVESIVLVDPIIRLETLAGGRVNWEFAPPEQKKPPAGLRQTQRRKTPEPSVVASADADVLRLDNVRIVNGTLVYREAGSETVQRIDRINAEISAGSLEGPFRLAGSLRTRGIPLAVEATVGRISEGASTPISLRVGFAVAETRLELAGTIAQIGTAPRMSGRLKLTGLDLAGFIAGLTGGALAPNALPPWLGQKFAVDVRLWASAKEASTTDFRAELGDVSATGTLAGTFGGRLKTTAKLRINRIDLDRWLAMTAMPGQAGESPAGAGTNQEQIPVAAESAAPAPFSLPKDIDASLDVTVAAVKYLGGQISDLRLAVALNEGEVTLNHATARLPGGAEGSLSGFLTVKGGKPDFDGSLEARADNLRTVLQWLKIDVSSVPADRLRKFTLAGKIKSDGDQLHLLDAKIGLDTSRISGAVTFVLQDRLSFGASINLDHLNVDAYLPVEKKPGAQTRKTTAKPADKAPGAANASGSPFAILNDFDANLRLRVGSLTYRRTAAQGIRIDGTLAAGKLVLRRLAVRSIAGTRANIKGTLTNFDKFPVFKGSFDADSKNLTGLARMAGVTLPVAPRKLGAMKLRGRVDADAEKVKLRIDLELAGAKARLTGDVLGLSRTPRFNGALNVSHPELARLLRSLGQDPGNGVRRLGAFGITTTVRGDMAALKLDARAKVAGATVSLAGSVSGLAAAPRFDLAFKASHPKYLALVKAFDPGYRTNARQIGPVSVAARIKGNPGKMSLSGLKVNVGDIAIEGEGTLVLVGKRPRLNARLTAGEIVIDPFLAPESSSQPRKRADARRQRAGAGPATAARFSNKPFEGSAMAPLAALDADIVLSAQALAYRNFRVERPVIKVVIDDRVLTVKQLSGRMFDGAFSLTGSLDARAAPKFDAVVKVEKANVGKALFEAGQFDIEGGIMDFDMTLRSAGRSERAMIEGLGGVGRIAVRNGAVRGFSLRALSDRLKNLHGGLDILRLFGASMGGGSTRFSSLDGTFTIDKGMFRTSDLRLVADGGQGRARGAADLPRWTMNFLAEFQLTEHPNTPPFGMIVRGPIDNPKRIFKIKKLQAHLLQRGIGGLLRRALPQQQPGKTRPEDILRGLLDGLR